MLPALVLALPTELPSLLTSGWQFRFGLIAWMGTTVLAQKGYTYERVVYPIASSFMLALASMP